jgi:hypothetical protein
MKSFTKHLIIFGLLFITAGCSQQPGQKLSDKQIEQIVKRSYQYVAMYNVNQKMAFEEEGVTTRGYNKGMRNTDLLDHTVQFIARPNNDVLYQLAMLDLTKSAIVFEIPAIDSKFVSLMATGYDHYVTIPMSTVKGDFKKPETILFYTKRTEGYHGEPIKGIDRTFEMTGDFVSLVMRVMPHADQPERYKRIVSEVHAIKGMSLAEFLGKPTPEADKLQFPPIQFPPFGKTDADIFGNNLLQVMQFVFNHTTFDPDFELDRKVLALYAPLGVAPGKKYNPEKVAKIDDKRFREISIKVRDEEIAKMNNSKFIARILPTLYLPKGQAGLESLLLVSVVGPIGQPISEAMYPPIVTEDGSPMNALHDYVIRMTKDELPPANAFWSFTLYDALNGFFIPNERKKYSVGENAGRKLNKDGGIDIYIAAEKPAGVPDENWLPIKRENLELTVTLRIYAPDLEKMKTWKAPKLEMLK